MQKVSQQTQNLTNKYSKYAKTYGLNSSNTTVSHLQTHQFSPSEMPQNQTNKILMTMATYECDFILLQNFYETGLVKADLEFKQIMKFKTNFPILHCHLVHQFIEVHQAFYLIGYLIDIYSNIYSINLTKVLNIIQKYPSNPIQYNILYQNYKGIQSVQKLYLQTPLMIKKYNTSIVTVNLKGQIGFIDLNQSKYLIESDYLEMKKYKMKYRALAANHNHFKCKYQNVILIAFHNNHAPFVLVNCNSLQDFQSQIKAQDKYQWMQDEAQISFCSIDSSTNLVAVTTVTQNISIYEILLSKQNEYPFYYLKKKFAFFVDKDVRFNNFDINYHIESVHASKGMVLIITSKEYILYDLVQRFIRRRGKSTQISCLKWGGIIDKNQNLVACYIVKGYNHINQAQSKIGKPNIHFKTLDANKKV